MGEWRICRDCGMEFFPFRLDSRRYCPVCKKARDGKAVRDRHKAQRRTIKRERVKGWGRKREAALTPFCGACGDEFTKARRPAVDHIVPKALVDSLSGAMNAEDELNLFAVDAKCHGKKRRAEVLLEGADVVGFIQATKVIGYPVNRVIRALSLYGLVSPEKEELLAR